MKKVNELIYNKLLLQANEAKDIGLKKLGSAVLNSIGPLPEDEFHTYDLNELKDDIYDGMWKLALNVLKYHNVDSVNIEKIDKVVDSFVSKFIEQIELSINIDNSDIGPLESELPGEFDKIDI